MVEADRPDRVEEREIVDIRRVIAVPGDDVERRMVEPGHPKIALEFGDHLEGLVAVLEGGDRRAEIARIGEAVGADRAQFWKPEERAVILADIASRSSVRQLDPELDAARNHGNFSGFRLDHAELGGEARTSPLSILRNGGCIAEGRMR